MVTNSLLFSCLAPFVQHIILPPFLRAEAICILSLVSLPWKLNIDYKYKTKYAKTLSLFFLFEKKSWQDFKLSIAGASQSQVF